MTISPLELVGKYASTFRKMIQANVLNRKGSIKRLLKLNKDVDYDFIIAAMDVLGDTCSAIANFQQFGLSGPTKFDDLGERYLRLYGLLSAAYIQQQAVLTIYKLMNVPNVTQVKGRFDDLEIRKLRHKLSSHSTDYLDRDAGGKQAYVPLRMDLGDRTITAVRHTGPMQHEKFDLSEAMQRHLELIMEILDTIIDKCIKTLFSQNSSKRQEFLNQLSDLRIEKSGGLVFKGPKGTRKIIVTFMGRK